MPLQAETIESRFLQGLISAENLWEKAVLEHIATSPFPERFFGERRKGLLVGDISLLWFEWFIQSLASPYNYVNPSKGFPHAFYDVLCQVKKSFPNFTEPEKQQLAGLAANVVWRKTQDLRQRRTIRSRLSAGERQELYTLAGSPPRCWVCGYSFQAQAINNFLNSESTPLVIPEFVDVYKPLGLRLQDLNIQVDHVHPFSDGGGDFLENLRLICGWCNRHKSDHISVYDVSGALTSPARPYREFLVLPRLFWVVRLIGTVSKCEHPEGCEKTAKNSELTVDRINPGGLPSPINLRVVCPEHHHMQSNRLIPNRHAMGLWGTTNFEGSRKG